jgi:curli biogenesis system outer membrane secretion channel CsgG
MKEAFGWIARGLVLSITASIAAFATGSAGSSGGGASPASMALAAGSSAPSQFDGLKKRLAVLRFENKVKTPLPDASWQIGDGLSEMVTTELFRTGRFIMVERSALADLVKEQELGQTGLIQKETSARVGELLGAQLLVAGAVTEFEAAAGGGGTGVGISGLALQLRTSFAHVGVDVRLVDSSTGQILKSYKAEAKAQDTGLGLAGNLKGGLTLGSDAFFKTPLGKATRDAIAKAVAFIVSEMETVPWSGRVVRAAGDEVYVNAGANVNLKPGTALAAYSKGEDLLDPASGLALGSRDKLVGTVTLTHIDEKFSVGTFSGDGALKRGDILKLK